MSVADELRVKPGTVPDLSAIDPRATPGWDGDQAAAILRVRELKSSLADFQQRHVAEAPAMLQRLQQAVIHDENVFATLMDAVRVCSLGQITEALFEVGGQYRRSM